MKESHIINICQAVGPVLGGCYNDRRKEKDSDSVNRIVKLVVTEANGGAKGLILSDCDLTAHDMNYLSATMPSNSYNFTVVDFSNNPQLGALGVDYLIKGRDGIEQAKLSTEPLPVDQRPPVPMFMGKPFILPPEMLQSMMEQAKTLNLDDFVFKGVLTRPNFNFQKLDLSGCNIGDTGADILGNALANGRLPSLKNIDLSGNGISLYKMNEFLSQISQDIFVITEKSYDTGNAVYKDHSGSLYDMTIKSDGKDAVIEFADGITGISGISAGDTCHPSAKDQIKNCLGGGVGTVVATWQNCSGSGNIKSQLVCSGGAFLTGCAAAVATIGTIQCVGGQEYKDSDSGFGFSVTGGTEIKGTTIDNDHGLVGSSFDLSQHDF